jgi:hypothetical protein
MAWLRETKYTPFNLQAQGLLLLFSRVTGQVAAGCSSTRST